MKRWYAYLISGGWVVVLAGCGFGHPEAITHNSKPKAVVSEILSRMSSWQNVRATVKETQIISAHQVKTLDYQITSNLPSGQYVINLLGSHPISIYVNSHETIWYPQNSKHYSVFAGLPAADAPWTIAAELPNWLRHSQVHGVRVKGDKVSLMMTLVLPSSKSPADALLIYDTATNTPESFSMQIGKTKIAETFSHFQVNPNVSASTFSFSPPPGVTPAISLTQTGTALNLAKSQLNFPIVLPPSSAGMTLDAINTGTNAQGQRVVILSFTAQDSSSVIITEKSSHHPITALPNSNLTSTTESVGSLTVVVANLPDNMEEAAFVVHNTEVIVEGNASTVDSLLNQWGNLPSLTSSVLPSSGSTPSSP
ncbi:hypothetical protein SAMN00768000_1575 [Sulfobacillus thermosulfidooxidans DSM 9293]|uniref:Uncharacterized protein n=1 Tax=Sulfobacillus thermosulfidooxidans (strain DSM 9293 / VKM B-1269 / AT-1) TaxID=929705 RepID=A0A1W1WDB5_SULTA|nr:hypothetical protein [Sulfobacillus thermosulfidooxidans]SMC04308.1 hypothetical protein SAMN00768000_1575 [Sulfobacillus thermosulfidooxidans DSM 9293]